MPLAGQGVRRFLSTRCVWGEKDCFPSREFLIVSTCFRRRNPSCRAHAEGRCPHWACVLLGRGLSPWLRGHVCSKQRRFWIFQQLGELRNQLRTRCSWWVGEFFPNRPTCLSARELPNPPLRGAVLLGGRGCSVHPRPHSNPPFTQPPKTAQRVSDGGRIRIQSPHSHLLRELAPA